MDFKSCLNMECWHKGDWNVCAFCRYNGGFPSFLEFGEGLALYLDLTDKIPIEKSHPMNIRIQGIVREKRFMNQGNYLLQEKNQVMGREQLRLQVSQKMADQMTEMLAFRENADGEMVPVEFIL